MAELSLEQIQKILEDIKAITLRMEIAETRLKERDKIVYDLLHSDLQSRILTEVNKTDLTDTGETSLHTHGASAPAAHKASHQDTGTDEISVAGLSGELADNQPPKSHALDTHSAPSGNIAMNSKKFTGLVDPSAAQDSATKKYVDDSIDKMYTYDTAVVYKADDGIENTIEHTQYVELKEFTFPSDFPDGTTVRISFAIYVSGGGQTYYGRIYVNDSPVGTERTGGQSSPTTYAEDFTIDADDTVQLMVKVSQFGTANVKEFRVIGTPYPLKYTITVTS